MRDLTPSTVVEVSQVCLQREGITQACGCLRFEARGAIFNSPCRIEMMSDLILSIEWRGAGCRDRRVKVEGIVIGCVDDGGGGYEITVVFLPGAEACAASAFKHLPN